MARLELAKVDVEKFVTERLVIEVVPKVAELRAVRLVMSAVMALRLVELAIVANRLVVVALFTNNCEVDAVPDM